MFSLLVIIFGVLLFDQSILEGPIRAMPQLTERNQLM